MNTSILLPIITGIFVGAMAGYLGSFMVLRRLALVGDALSHVALPGVALAYMWHINPFLGAFAALAIGTVLIWAIEYKTSISTEALVGLMFTVALAVGLLITPEDEIFHALIGDISSVTMLDTIIAVVLSGVVFAAMRSIQSRFMLSTISPDLAKSSRISVSAIHFIFLLLVAIIVALGIKVVGTLLMGALVVIPAIAARQLAGSLQRYTMMSMFFGMASVVAGILIASAFSLPAGPIIVLASTGIFVVAVAFKK